MWRDRCGRLDGRLPTAWCGVRIPAGLEPNDGYDLIPGPDSDCEGAGAAEEDGVGGIVGPLQGRNYSCRKKT